MFNKLWVFYLFNCPKRFFSICGVEHYILNDGDEGITKKGGFLKERPLTILNFSKFLFNTLFNAPFNANYLDFFYRQYCFEENRFPDFSSPNCDCFVPQYYVGFWTAPLIWASLITGDGDNMCDPMFEKLRPCHALPDRLQQSPLFSPHPSSSHPSLHSASHCAQVDIC